MIFQEVENKKLISKNIFFFYFIRSLNIICFVEKNNIILRFFLCIFENDTVKSDCPMQENYEQTVGLL